MRTNTAAWVAITLAGFSTPCWGAVYSDTTDLNLARSRALPYIAANGGPAVTVETYKSDGTLIDFFSGSLLTSPDGKNRTVATAGHGWVHALAHDPNAYALIVTGSNRSTDRGQVIPVSEVRLAPRADGSLDSIDLAVMRLSTDVPNTGQFIIGSTPPYRTQLTTTGVGYILTQSQLSNGTYEPDDGSYARFDGYFNPFAYYGSDTYLDTSVFQVGQYPYGGVSASGDSGAGTFIASSIQFDNNGRITYGQYVGTNVGYGGDRLSSFSGSLFVDANYPETYQFLNDAIAVPEPSSLALMGAIGGSLILARQRWNRTVPRL